MTSRYAIEMVVDARPETGLGHLSRSLTLAERLCADGSSVVLRLHGTARILGGSRSLADLETKEFSSADELTKELLASWTIKHPHLLITDSYLMGEAFYGAIRRHFPSVPHLAFEDAGEKHGMSVIGTIRPHIGPAGFGEGEGPHQPPFAFQGPQYILIRNDLDVPDSKPAEGTARTVLVAMGGSDPEGQTVRLARALQGKELSCSEVCFLLGPAFDHPDRVRELAQTDSRFRVEYRPTSLRRVMARATVAICGGGATLYELMYLGVPCLLLVLAPNQDAAARAVAQQGAGKYLGPFGHVSDDQVLAALRTMLDDSNALNAMSSKATSMVDGRGAQRLSGALHGFLSGYHGDPFPIESLRAEYDAAAGESEEYKRLKWGSEAGMLNRFAIARRTIQWEQVNSWLDIGSGTGRFLREVEKTRIVQRFVGIDLSPALTAIANAGEYRSSHVQFRVSNFLDSVAGGTFDLVTLLGVLQKCGASIWKAIACAAERVAPGGQLFLTTKNLDWKRFREPGFLPEPDHHWFRWAVVESAIENAGLDLIRMASFEPATGEIFGSHEESHCLFALARRPVRT